jgi:uncharacterized protein YecA (UPF0149 family)
MLLADDKERLLLEINFDNSGSVNNVDFQFIQRESIAQDEIEKLEAIAEILRNKRIDRVQREEGKIGRNATCPCGSGKKYKKCCLRREN